MLAIPFLVMGWTIGRSGPGSDDWTFLNRFYHGIFSTWDTARPLHSYSEALLYLIAGGRVPIIQALYCLLESLSAALYFEVLRRILQRWLGRIGIFAALLTSLVYVLYPSYADRLWLIMIQDSMTRALTAGIALLWVIGSEKDKPRFGIAGTALMIVTLLHKENSTLIFGLFPLILLHYGRSILQGKWRRATALWWGALGGYIVWHVMPPSLGGINGIGRAVTFTDPWGAVKFFAGSLYNVMFLAYRVAFVEAGSELQQMGWGWAIPAALAGAGLVVAGGWLASRNDIQAEPARVSLRAWALMCLSGLVVALLGLALFYVQLGHPTPIGGVESRNTTTAMMGISLTYGMIALLPMLASRQTLPPGGGQSPGRVRLGRAGGLALSGLLGALLLAGGVIRQTRLDIAYVNAWRTQRAYWQRIAELEVSIHPGSLVVMDSFPRFDNGAPLAASNWGYQDAFGLLFEAPPDILTINDGGATHPRLSGDTLTVTVYGDQITYPLEDVRVLYYDKDTQSVELEPQLPLSWTRNRVYIYTGDNLAQTPPPMSPYSLALLGPAVEPGLCRSKVPGSTRDVAPTGGVVEVATFPQNLVLDRRPVSQGAPLEFSFLAPCGTWLRVYFLTQTADNKATMQWLVSQYGAGSDYGTADSGPSISYSTAFQGAVSVEPIH